jgi:glycosyltransferase involved in cell wall biosynthesis
MKRVMMIAYPFPPEGSATSYRTLRHVRQLPNLGWNCQIITAIPSQYERFDSKLLDMVPNETEVIRVHAYDAWQRFQAWRSRTMEGSISGASVERVRQLHNSHLKPFRSLLRNLVRTGEAAWYQPDVAMPWIKPAVKKALKVCEHRRPNILWANAGRVSAFHIAQKVSAHTGIPYVLDFDDSWTITHNDFEARQPRWARRLARRTMYQLLKEAQAVVFRYHTEAECFWRAYRDAMDASTIYIIPNGYESPIEPFEGTEGGKCTIVYAGVVADYRYDTLLKAVSGLKQSDPGLVNRLCLHFIGEGMEDLAKDAAKMDISDIVLTSGPMPYGEIVTLQRNAHALLVLGRPATKPGYELFAGAKLFGYLKAGRPIIGVLPNDETKKVLHCVGATTVASVDSVPEIAQILRNVMNHWSSGTLSSLVPDRKACEAYSSERQTTTLVCAFEGLPPEEPFVPGQQEIPLSLRHIIEDKNWLDGDNA